MSDQLFSTVFHRLQEKLAISIGLKLKETFYRSKLNSINKNQNVTSLSLIQDNEIKTNIHSPELSKHNKEVSIDNKSQIIQVKSSPDVTKTTPNIDTNQEIPTQSEDTLRQDSNDDFANNIPQSGQSLFNLADIWFNYPRLSSFYFPLLSSITNISGLSSDYIISLMIGWLPQRKIISSDLNFPTLLEDFEENFSENKISFTDFASKIPNMVLSDQIHLDLVELSVLQVVGDILGIIIRKDSNIQNPEKIVQLCLSILSDTNSRAIDSSTWMTLMKPVRSQWSIVLGSISTHSFVYLKKFISSELPKLPQEIQINILQGLFIPFHKASEEETADFLSSFIHQFLTKEKSTTLKMSQIDAVDSWIRVIDATEGGSLHTITKQIFKIVLRVISKNEELENIGYRLLTTIISRSPLSFADKHIDTMLMKYWTKGVVHIKKKDLSLECILRILRGSYPYFPNIPDDPNHIFFPNYHGNNKSFDINQGITYSYDIVKTSYNEYTYSPYSYCGLIYHQEKLKSRLMYITNILFPQKTSIPKINESYDLLTEIVVQIASHSIHFMVNDLMPQLLNGPLQYKLICMRALNKILSKNYRFLEESYSIINEDTDGSMRKTIYFTFMKLLTDTLVQCHKQMKKEKSKYDPLSLYTPKLYISRELYQYILPICLTSNEPYLRTCGERISMYYSKLNPRGAKDYMNYEYYDSSAYENTSFDSQKLISSSTNSLDESLSTPYISNNRTGYFYFDNSNTILNKYREYCHQSNFIVEEAVNSWCQISKLMHNVNFRDIDPEYEKPTNIQPNQIKESKANKVNNKKTSNQNPSKRKTETYNAAYELYKEAISYYHIVLQKDINQFVHPSNFFIGNLLFHNDEDISSICLYQLQQAMINIPIIRPILLKNMTSMVRQYMMSMALYSPDNGELNDNIFSILSQLLLFIDLWNIILLPTSKDEKIDYFLSDKDDEICPEYETFIEIESISLVSLCFPNPLIRGLGLHIMRSIDLLKRKLKPLLPIDFFENQSLNDILMKNEKKIIQNARYKYLLDLSNGLKVKLNKNNQENKLNIHESLSIENIALSNHKNLWCFILAEIGYHVAESKNINLLLILGSFLKSYLDLWKGNVFNNLSISFFESINANISTFSMFFEMIHILRFSTMYNDLNDMNISDESMIKSKNNIFKINEYINEIHSIHSEIFKYIPILLKQLSHEERILSDAIISSISKVNGELLHDIIIYVWNAYIQCLGKSKKKNITMKMDISSILSKISRHDKFKSLLKKYDRIIIIYINFISEMKQYIQSKTPSIYNGQFFIDLTCMIINFLDGISSKNMVCCMNGPLRVYISPDHIKSKLSLLEDGNVSPNVSHYSLKDYNNENDENFYYSNSILSKLVNEMPNIMNGAKIQWKDIVDLFIERCLVGEKSQARKNMDGAEIIRILNKIKNQDKRREMEKIYLYFIGLMKQVSLYALYHLSRFGFTTEFVHQYSQQQLYQQQQQQMNQQKGIRDISQRNYRELKNQALEWAIEGEKRYGYKILKYIIASNIDSLSFFIDQCYQHKDSHLFIHAIYDQFLEEIDDDKLYDGIDESTIDFFNEYNQRLKDRLREEKSSISKADKSFTKTIVSYAGRLIFLVLSNLSNASKEICERSFDLLCRLGPISFGWRNHLADYYLANRFQELKDIYVSNLEKMSRERALEVASLVSNSCSRFTEDVFREAFIRFDKSNESTKIWISQFLTKWETNIKFIENTNNISSIYQHEEIQWKYYNKESFLEKLYSKITIVLSSSITIRNILLSLWTGLTNIKNNTYVIIDFLIEKSIRSNDDNNQCKMIILELYKMDPETIIDHMIHKMKKLFSLIHFNQEGSDNDNNNSNSNDIILKNEKMLSSILSILSDIFIENIVPCFNYLHIIFNFILLNINKHTVHLLHCILIPIRNILKEEDKKVSRDLIRSNGILDSLLTLLKFDHFNIEWYNYDDISNNNSSTYNNNNIFFSFTPKKKGGGINTLNDKESSSLIISKKYHNNNNNNINTSNLYNFKSPRFIVEILVVCAQLVINKNDIIEKWLQELNDSWIHVGFSSLNRITYATKSLELYYILLDHLDKYSSFNKKVDDDDEYENEDNEDEDDDDKFIFSDYDERISNISFINVLRQLRKTAFQCLIHLERYIRITSHESLKFLSITDRQKHLEILNMSKLRFDQLLRLYKHIVKFIKDENEIMEVLWIVSCILNLSPLSFPSLYEKGLGILYELIEYDKFSILSSSSSSSLSIYQKYMNRFKSRGYDGLFLLVLKGLTINKNEVDCIRLLIEFIRMDVPDELIYGKLKYNELPLLLLSILPWMKHQLDVFQTDMIKDVELISIIIQFIKDIMDEFKNRNNSNNYKQNESLLLLSDKIDEEINHFINEYNNINIISLSLNTSIRKSTYYQICNYINSFIDFSLKYVLNEIRNKESSTMTFCYIIEYMIVEGSVKLSEYMMDISNRMLNEIENVNDKVNYIKYFKYILTESTYKISDHNNYKQSSQFLKSYSKYIQLYGDQNDKNSIDPLLRSSDNSLKIDNMRSLKPAYDYLHGYQKKTNKRNSKQKQRERRKSSSDGSSSKHSRQKSTSISNSKHDDNKKKDRYKSSTSKQFSCSSSNNNNSSSNRGGRSRSKSTASGHPPSLINEKSGHQKVKSSKKKDFFSDGDDNRSSSDDEFNDDDLIENAIDMDDSEFEKLKLFLSNNHGDIDNLDLDDLDDDDDDLDDDDDDDDLEMRDLMLKEFNLDGIDFSHFDINKDDDYSNIEERQEMTDIFAPDSIEKALQGLKLYDNVFSMDNNNNDDDNGDDSKDENDDDDDDNDNEIKGGNNSDLNNNTTTTTTTTTTLSSSSSSSSSSTTTTTTTTADDDSTISYDDNQQNSLKSVQTISKPSSAPSPRSSSSNNNRRSDKHRKSKSECSPLILPSKSKSSSDEQKQSKKTIKKKKESIYSHNKSLTPLRLSNEKTLQTILNNESERSAFIEFLNQNNYNSGYLDILKSIEDFKSEESEHKCLLKAKRLIDRYFPKKMELSTVPIDFNLRNELLEDYQEELRKNNSKSISKSLFDDLYKNIIHMIATNYLPMYLKSDQYKKKDK